MISNKELREAAILNGATLLGELAGSYAAHVRDRNPSASQRVSIWENRLWCLGGAMAGRLVGLIITNPKNIWSWK